MTPQSNEQRNWEVHPNLLHISQMISTPISSGLCVISKHLLGLLDWTTDLFGRKVDNGCLWRYGDTPTDHGLSEGQMQSLRRLSPPIRVLVRAEAHFLIRQPVTE
jgi:hypothetical protein